MFIFVDGGGRGGGGGQKIGHFCGRCKWITPEMKKQTPIYIATTTAKIIKCDLRVLTCDKSDYPLIEKMNDIDYCKWWLPESLLTFLQNLIPSEVKQVSIGQYIAQTSRPRSVLASITFDIGGYIDKSFTTR